MGVGILRRDFLQPQEDIKAEFRGWLTVGENYHKAALYNVGWG